MEWQQQPTLTREGPGTSAMEEPMKDTRFRSAFTAGAVTPQDVLDFHRRAFGLARMEGSDTSPERPDGVSEDEWNALQDTGKRALVREREARQSAEQEAAALRAARTPKPGPPKNDDGKGGATQPAGGQQQTDPADIATIVQQAVAAAIQPFQEAQQQSAADDAARKVAESVTTAAAATSEQHGHHDRGPCDLPHAPSPGSSTLCRRP